MPEPTLTVDVDLGDNGGHVSFANGSELKQWKELQMSRSQWLASNNGLLDRKYEEIRQALQTLDIEAGEFDRWLANGHEGNLKLVISRIATSMTQNFASGQILVAGTAKANVVEQVRKQFGDHAAAGAYASLTQALIQGGNNWPPRFIEGLIHGANYLRGVDWTATAHRLELDKLYSEYSGNLSSVKKDFEQLKTAIERQRQEIVESEQRQAAAYLSASEERTAGYQSAQDERAKKWDELLKEHIAKISNIESVYDQKLALQKPVKYWETKSTSHNTAAIIYGVASIVVGAGCIYGLIELVRWAFGGLKPTDAPQHWHLAVLGIAAFFAVWIVRILLRLLFSHLHLKTDAEERRIMILTFLAMSREGAEFAPGDKSLIVQHLFRSASDGLVKGDSAPPGILEYITRAGK